MKTTGNLPARSGKKVLSVDDHFIVNVGLQLLIEDFPAFTLCGQATCGREAMALAEQHQPEVVILDLILGSADGLELMQDIRRISPASQFLIYSSLDEGTHGWRALRAGATGYIMKSAPPEEIGRAMQEVARGKTYASLNLQNLMKERMVGRKTPDRSLSVLSDRELQVFRLLGGGKSSFVIAKETDLSPTTVRTYRERIKQKLLIRDAGDLEYAARHFLQTGNLPAISL